MSDVTVASPNAEGNSEKKRLQKIAANSDFLTARQPARKSARLSSALLDYKRPDGLNLVPLGTTWAVDLFVRPHNGVRRELIDLYNIVDSLQRRVQHMRSQDLKLFFRWWKQFACYLETAINLGDKVLIPWALNGSTAPQALDDAVRSAGKEHLNLLLQSFSVIQDQLARRPPDESLAKIIKALTHVHAIFEFMEAIESTMPEIADANRDEKQGRRMEKRVAVYLSKNGESEKRKLHLLIMARGMTEEVQSAWRRRLPPKLRIIAASQKNHFRVSHLNVVDKLALVD